MQIELHKSAVSVAVVRAASVTLSGVWILMAIYLWTRHSSDRTLSASLAIVATANAWYTVNLTVKKARLRWMESALLALNVICAVLVGVLFIAFATYVHGSAVSH